MQTQAKLRHLRISPRKVRLVVDAIRGQEVQAALDQLQFIRKKASLPVSKLLKSSIANAEHNHELKKDNLYIKEIKVDEGPSLKRWRPRAFGRASAIQKRTSHISLILAEIKPTTPKADKKKKQEKTLDKAKVVKSLDEIKDKPEEKSDKLQDQPTPKIDEKGNLREPVDTTRMGTDRHKQHLDKVSQKEKDGALKRMFRRKSV
jgi:large subunit ribosomal protein L22